MEWAHAIAPGANHRPCRTQHDGAIQDLFKRPDSTRLLRLSGVSVVS